MFTLSLYKHSHTSLQALSRLYKDSHGLYLLFYGLNIKRIRILTFSGGSGYTSLKLRAVFGGLRVVNIIISKNPFNPNVLTSRANCVTIFILKIEKKNFSH